MWIASGREGSRAPLAIMLAYDWLMPVAARSSRGDGVCMRASSQIVILDASAEYHILCGAPSIAACDNAAMTDMDRNGGPNHLRAWREFRGLSQAELAERVGTNQNMIGYLETGERGLSAKWLRKLAAVLGTQPGHLLEHDPSTLPTDIVEIWFNATLEERRQLVQMARVIVKDGTNG